MFNLIGSKINKFYVGCIIIIVCIIASLLFDNTNNKKNKQTFVIAYGEDLASLIIKSIENSNADIKLESKDISYINIGDCCGSNAQFAFATGEVDAAILCPDAVSYLEDLGKGYVVVGNVLYDSDVFIYSDKIEKVKKIAYMNKRYYQRDLMEEKFDSEKEYIPIIPSGIPYAMTTGAIDAACVDVMNYLELNYDCMQLSKNRVTQVLVVKKELFNDERYKRFVDMYNDVATKMNTDKEYLYDIIAKNVTNKTKEEIIDKWKRLQVQFGYLKKIN